MGTALQSSPSRGEANTLTELTVPSAKEPGNALGGVSLPSEPHRLKPERTVERAPEVSRLILHVLRHEGPLRHTLYC